MHFQTPIRDLIDRFVNRVLIRVNQVLFAEQLFTTQHNLETIVSVAGQCVVMWGQVGGIQICKWLRFLTGCKKSLTLFRTSSGLKRYFSEFN